MTRFVWIGSLIIVVAGIVFGVGHQPAPVSAGGFPCFMCHGVNFEGSDLAPTVAGTKLTDEQIANQMRHPRGVMPAFGPNDWPDPQTAISYIRTQPTGKPTLALSDQQRSVALALIAGAASARATEYAHPAGSSAMAMPTPPPQSPIPAASPTLIASPAPRDSSSSPGAIAAIGGLLLAMVAVVWVGMRR